MNIDFKQIKVLAAQVPDIMSKGQQIINAAQNVLNSFHGTDNQDKMIDHISEQEISDKPVAPNTIAPLYREISDNEMVLSGVSAIKVPGDVVALIGEMNRQANETIRYCEEQKTVRTEIRVKADVEIRKIDAMADMVRDYLKRSFDERAEIFDEYFSILDEALECGNNILVAQTLQSINSLAASSPFKALADIDKVSNMLAEGGEWDI